MRTCGAQQFVEGDGAERPHFNVIVFVGANQAKVTYQLASVLQGMGDRVAIH